MSINDSISSFNSTLELFIKYLRSIRNGDNDILYYQTAVNGIIRANYKQCIEKFILNMLKYNDKIIAHDEDFFFNLDIESQIGDDKNSILQLLKFKKITKGLSEEVKNNIFDFLEVLVYHSKKYLNFKYPNLESKK